MNVFCPQQLHMGTARMKENKGRMHTDMSEYIIIVSFW